MSWIDTGTLTGIPDGTPVNAVLWDEKVTQPHLDLAARVADGGWQNLTGLDSAWTAGTGDLTPQYRVIGSTVFIRGDVSRTSSTLATALGFTSNLFTVLPASARPSGQWLQRCTAAVINGAILELRVGTDGGLSLRNVGSAALAVGVNVGLFTSYPIG